MSMKVYETASQALSGLTANGMTVHERRILAVRHRMGHLYD